MPCFIKYNNQMENIKILANSFHKICHIFEPNKTCRPKTHTNQTINLVKDLLNIYYIIVNSYHTFKPFSQKKIVKFMCYY